MDEALLLVFSDVLVLTGRQANASGGVRASVVLAQFDLTATELEDDSLLSWSEDSESSSAGVAGAAASASSPGGRITSTCVFRFSVGLGPRHSSQWLAQSWPTRT